MADKLRRVCRNRLKDPPGEDFIFKNRQRDAEGMPWAVSRKTTDNGIQDMGKIARMDVPPGCHSLRKTFGCHYCRQAATSPF